MSEYSVHVDPDIVKHNEKVHQRIDNAKKLKLLPEARTAEYRAAEIAAIAIFDALVKDREATHQYTTASHLQKVYLPFDVGEYMVLGDDGEEKSQHILVEAAEYHTGDNHKYALNKGHYKKPDSNTRDPWMSGRSSVIISERTIETPRQIDETRPLSNIQLRHMYEFIAQLVNIASYSESKPQGLQ